MDDWKQIQKEKYEKTLVEKKKIERENTLMKYCIDTWIWTMKPRRVAGAVITRAIKNHYYLLFPDPVNIDLEQVHEIPGIFRKRLRFTQMNTKQIPKPLSHAQILKHRKEMELERQERANKNRRREIASKRSVFFDKKKMFDAVGIAMTQDEALNKALTESLKDAMSIDDEGINHAITKSLQEIPMDTDMDIDIGAIDDEIDISDFVDDSDHTFEVPVTNGDQSDEDIKKLTADYLSDDVIESRFPKLNDEPEEDEMLQLAISESLKQHKIISQDDMISFYVVIDLRIYGPDPYQPIFIDNEAYYLNKDQIKIVQNIWNKINPDTISGSVYHTSIAEQKSIACDIGPSYLDQF